MMKMHRLASLIAAVGVSAVFATEPRMRTIGTLNPPDVRQGTICLQGSQSGFVAHELIARGVVPVRISDCLVLIRGPEQSLTKADIEMLRDWLDQAGHIVVMDGTGEPADRDRILNFAELAFGGGYAADAIAYSGGTSPNERVATPLFTADHVQHLRNGHAWLAGDYSGNTVDEFFFRPEGNN